MAATARTTVPPDTAEDASTVFTHMSAALAAAVAGQDVDAASDHLRSYLEREDPDVDRVTRLLQLLDTAAVRVADLYRRWKPGGPWAVEPAAPAGESPTGAAVLSAGLVELVLNHDDDDTVGDVVAAAVEGEPASRVLGAVLELAATYGMAALAIATAK